MNRPTIKINGKDFEMKKLKGKDWRIFGEFVNEKFSINSPEYVEKLAEFISNFFEGVTVNEVLEMPLEEILPSFISIRDYFTEQLMGKIGEVEKNSGEVKAEQ